MDNLNNNATIEEVKAMAETVFLELDGDGDPWTVWEGSSYKGTFFDLEGVIELINQKIELYAPSKPMETTSVPGLLFETDGNWWRLYQDGKVIGMYLSKEDMQSAVDDCKRIHELDKEDAKKEADRIKKIEKNYTEAAILINGEVAYSCRTDVKSGQRIVVAGFVTEDNGPGNYRELKVSRSKKNIRKASEAERLQPVHSKLHGSFYH